MGDRQETEEADGGDTVRPDDKRPSCFMSVGEHSNNRRTDCTESVDRDSQELGVCFRVSKAEDDARCSVSESVYRNGVSLPLLV